MAKKSKKIDWDQFQEGLSTSGDIAARQTDDQLAEQLAAITRLTRHEIKELFPKQSDVEKLAELMQIVNASTTTNNKINKIVNNAEDFADIILRLMKKLL